MEVRFCDLCNESVPQSDLDTGRAVVRKGRVICVTCDRAMSVSGPLASGAPSPAVGREHAGAPGTTTPAPHASPSSPASMGGSPASTVIASEHVETFVLSGGPEVVLADRHGTYASASPHSSTSVASIAPVTTSTSRSSSTVGLWVAVLGLLFTAGAIAVFNDRLKLLGEDDRTLAQVLDGQKASLTKLEKLPQKLNDDLRAVADNARRDQSLESHRIQAVIDGLDADIKRSSTELQKLASAVDALRLEANNGQASWGQRIDDVSKRIALQEDTYRAQAEKLAELEELAKNPPIAAVASNGAGGPAAEPAQASWKALVGDLASPNSGLRWEAVDRMGTSLDPETVPYLVPMLKDADLFVRMATARVLGTLSSPKAIPPLIDALEDSDSAMREAALIALHQITGRDFQFDPLGNEAERTRKLKSIRDWWKKTEENGGFKKEGAAGN